MQAYGSKRTFGNCRTARPRRGGKIHVRVATKNRKLDRRAARRSTPCLS